MSKLRVDISMSLDGYIAGPEPSEQHPLGIGGMQLHEWIFKLAAWREPHGLEGGEDGPSNQVVQESLQNIGAIIMGRNMFGGGPGPWGEKPWNGWWNEEPPFRMPVFVLTNHPREPLEMAGGTTFFFVTDGIESALGQARKAAGDKDVALAGGASVIQQYLAAGVVSELQTHVVPLLLHRGTRLFEDLGAAELRLEPIGVVSTPEVTHLKYRTVI
jgi:dihydrofolate reductase